MAPLLRSSLRAPAARARPMGAWLAASCGRQHMLRTLRSQAVQLLDTKPPHLRAQKQLQLPSQQNPPSVGRRSSPRGRRGRMRRRWLSSAPMCCSRMRLQGRCRQDGQAPSCARCSSTPTTHRAQQQQPLGPQWRTLRPRRVKADTQPTFTARPRGCDAPPAGSAETSPAELLAGRQRPVELKKDATRARNACASQPKE